MVRAVKTKPLRSLAKGQHAVLLPGATGAEPWEVWTYGGKEAAQLLQTCASPEDNRLRRNTTLALPAAQVYCLPLWLNETDPKQFAGMITLQLEMRGLQPRGDDAPVFDSAIVAKEDARTLVMVAVLPATLPPELAAESYESFDLSARYLPFREDTLTIWKEQDRFAIAITRGASLTYFQTLVEAQVTARLLQDLICIRQTLSMQGVVRSLRRIVAWTELSLAESTLLQEAMQLPLEAEERPAPVAPTAPWKLTPAVVGEARRRREVHAWQKKGLLVVLLIYLVVAAAFTGRYFLLSHQVDDLRAWQASHVDAVNQVHDARAAWKELGPVVNTNDYPLEVLLHAKESIPTDQLHLTLFETTDGRVLIKGEAKNVAAAFQFLDKLKSDPHLSDYTWSMGQPNILPNDLAQLQIEGTHVATN